MARGKLAEMVEAEAAQAEAESPDEDEDAAEAEDADAADEPDAEDAADEAESAEDEGMSGEAFARGLEAEIRRHSEALGRLFGAGYEAFVECPTCNLLGVIDPSVFPVDATIQRCERCQGRGELLTGATNPNNITRQCPQCFGNGWTDRPPEPVVIPPMPQPTIAFNTAPNTATMTPANGTTPAIPPMPVYDANTNTWRDPQTGEVLGGGAPSPVPVPPAA